MADSEYGQLSPFRNPPSMDETTARELIGRLELRARADDEIAARAAYLDLLGVAPGERVLDVGCGSGVVLRDVARRVAPGGRAVGVDPGAIFLEAARDLAAQAGLADLVELHAGDARALPFDGAEFDAVLAVTVLCHVPDGERAIPEMARVVRPGGRVGVFDFAGDTFVVSHRDRPLTRRIMAAAQDNRTVDGWIGRRLPRLLLEAGLRDVKVRGFTSIEQDAAGFYANQARQWAASAEELGVITAEERQHWLDPIESDIAIGAFMAGVTQLFVWATRPALG